MAGLFFTNPSDSSHHSGTSIGVVKNGDTQTSINEKLAKELEELKSKLSQSSSAAPVSNTDAIENKSGFGTTDNFTSTDSKAKITVTPNAASIDVFYDLTDALGKDTKLYNKVSVEGLKNGSQAIIVDSDKLSSGFSLSPNNFPAYLTIDLRKRTDLGDVFLSAKVQLVSTGGDLSTNLYSRNFGGTELNTQTKVNDFLFDRVKKVEGSIQNTVTVAGKTKTIQEAINDLHFAVENLKNLDLSDINVTYTNTESSTGSVSKPISEVISDISNRLNELSSNN